MNKNMKDIAKFLVGWLVLCSAAHSTMAQQIESPVDCTEGNEPLALVYGDHTTSCEIVPATDLDRFTFCAQSGELARVNLHSPGNFMDPEVVVRGPMGAIVAERSCNDNCSLSIDLPIAKAGCHSIFVSDLNTISTGGYSLQIERLFPLSSDTTSVGYDQTQVDSIDPSTDIDHFSFDGTEGSEIRLNIHSPNNFMDPTVEIRNSNGEVVLNGIDDGATCNDNCAFSKNVLLTSTDTYSMIIYDRNGISTGGYSFSLWCLYGDCEGDGSGDPIPDGPTISYVSEVPDTIESSVDGDFYRFNASLDTELRLTVHSPANFMDPTVEIRDPDGDLVLNGVMDGATCNDNCAFSVDLIPQKAGVHSLLIYDRNTISTGIYDIGLWCLSGPCDSDGDGVIDGTARISYEVPAVLSYGIATNESIDSAVDADIYIFGGTVGDLISLSVSSPNNFMDPTIEIRDPNNTVIVNGVDSGATCNDNCSFSLDLNITETGTYSLLIYDRNHISTGNYELGLQCLIGSCIDAIAMCGDNCIEIPNGPLIPDAGGNSQLDSDGDGQGNACDGDLDQSGVINFLDISQWVPFFLTTNPDGDLNGDGIANFLDFALLTEQFLSEPGPSCESPITN